MLVRTTKTNKQTNKEFTLMIYQKWSEIKLLMHGFVSLSIQLIITSKLGNQYMQRVLVTCVVCPKLRYEVLILR